MRSQLLVGFLISTCLVAALVGLNASQSFDSARRNAATQVLSETSSQAQSVETTLQAMPQYLRSLVEQRSVRSLAPGACRGPLQDLGRLAAGIHIVIVDESGRVECSDGSLNGIKSIGRSQWLTDTFAGSGGVGGPLTDPTNGQVDIAFSLAFRAEDGRNVALVGMGAAGVLIGMTAHNNVDPYLVDTTTGQIFGASPSDEALIGRTVDRTQLRRLLDAQQPLTISAVDGAKRITAAMPIQGTPWALVGGLPYAAAMAPARHDVIRNLEFGGALVLVLLALGILMHRRITRPLHRLRRAMEHVGDDSVGTRAPVTGPAEFVDLAQTFNAMLDARARSEARFRSLARYDSDFVAVVDPAGRITYANPRAASAFCIDLEQDKAVDFIRLVDPRDCNHVLRLMDEWRQAPEGVDSRAEFRLVTSAGEIRYVEAHVQNLLSDPSVQGLIITCGDITERKAAEDRLTRAALNDALTGLPNRTLVMDRLEHVLERSTRDNTLNAVLFLDLDSFKLINDTAGHGTGDTLLLKVAERLSALVRPGDTLGRLGGDEFVVICENLVTAEDAEVIARRLIEARTAPYIVNGQEIYIGGSIGIAIARAEDTASGLLRDADVAMYRAKADGRGSVCVFDDAMRVETHNRLDIENALQRALERNELSLHYQPLVTLDGDRLVSLEALLRWTTADGTNIRPDEFIPIAEDTGLIVGIGTWVIDEGCRQLAAWTRSHELGTDVALAVNVSARQLIQPDFPSMVAAILDRHDIAPERLIIEITESTVIRDPVTCVACLNELRALGVRISVDDFGTGYSSLGYLQRLPIDELKIDRAFVSPLSTGARAASIVQSIVSLGHALGLTVIAEGVESRAQQRRLRQIGCDVAQGFLFARPMPAADVAGWVNARAPRTQRRIPAVAGPELEKSA